MHQLVMTATVFTWAVVVWCLVMAALSTWQYLRARRNIRRMTALWHEQAPPIEPVQVRLVTGETVTVKPEGPQQCWTWFVRVPEPHLVDEVELPELPPWTTVIPVPENWPRATP